MAKDLAALSGSLSAQKFSLGKAYMQIDITMLTSLSTAERKQIFMSRYDVDCLLVLLRKGVAKDVENSGQISYCDPDVPGQSQTRGPTRRARSRAARRNSLNS